MADTGRVGSADQALVSDGAAQGVSTLTGFDPSRIPYRPFDVAAGQVWRSQGYAMFLDHVEDARGDPTVELWRFAGEDDYEDGLGWLEVRLHEIVETERSGTLAVYYRQWFDPQGEPAWGNRPKRTIGAVGSLKALIRRRKMKIALATEARRAATPQSDAVHEGAGRDSGNAQTTPPAPPKETKEEPQ